MDAANDGGKRIDVNVDIMELFVEILDRYEESVREEASAIANRQGPEADKAQLRKLRYRKAVIEYVTSIRQKLEEQVNGN